jgi:dihydroorotase
VTTFLEMPNTRPTTTTPEALEDKLQRAASKCVVNYGFYVGASYDQSAGTSNVEVLKNVRRTPGIKIFIGSSTGDLLVDDQEALERIFAETTLPICAHCEDETTVRENIQRLASTTNVADHSRIRDASAAYIATKRAIDLATRHRHPFHVLHVSTRLEAELLRAAPEWVTAEACPHHLFFTVDDYERLGTLVQMNPSVKTADDAAALWEALHDGRIEVIATDHAPHTLDEKRQPYPKSPSRRGACARWKRLRVGCAKPPPGSGRSTARGESKRATTLISCWSISSGGIRLRTGTS